MSDSKIIIKLLKEQQKHILKIEKKLDSLTGATPSIKLKKLQKTTYSGLTNSIFELISDSFFNTPRNLKEIINEMKTRAVFDPRTNYPQSLLKLIKDKKLRRIKKDKKWKYVKYG